MQDSVRTQAFNFRLNHNEILSLPAFSCQNHYFLDLDDAQFIVAQVIVLIRVASHYF